MPSHLSKFMDNSGFVVAYYKTANAFAFIKMTFAEFEEIQIKLFKNKHLKALDIGEIIYAAQKPEPSEIEINLVKKIVEIIGKE